MSVRIVGRMRLTKKDVILQLGDILKVIERAEDYDDNIVWNSYLNSIKNKVRFIKDNL